MKNKYVKFFNMFIIFLSVVILSSGSLSAKFVFVSDENEKIVQKKKSLPSVKEILEFEKTLKISRPSSDVSVDADSYYITGTCDPSETLYVNGKAVDGIEHGVFGVEVSLESEENVFTFKQGEEEKKVCIYKNKPQSVIKKNMTNKRGNNRTKPPYPVVYKVVTEKKINLSCPAPKGASVTAIVDGVEFEMSPDISSDLADEIQFSCEATFDGENYSEEYYNVGSVKYIVTYNGETKELFSDGYVIFSTDENLSTGFVEVTRARASIFEEPNMGSNILTTIKKGCVLAVDESENNDEWFKLQDFGWIMKSAVCPADPNSDIENSVSSVALNVDDNQEMLVLNGSCKPNFASVYSSSGLTVRLYHTKGVEINESCYSKSNLIETITTTQGPVHTDIIFKFKDGSKLLGYNVEYDDDNTIIVVRSVPVTEGDSDKLNNVSIMLDAGHGGFDRGATGLLGQVGGPNEKDFNLAYALKLKERLEQMGADVSITRTTDTHNSLSGIAEKAEFEKPDLFISLHSDSVDDNISPEKVTGYSVFYNNREISGGFAQIVDESLSKQGILNSRGYKPFDYYVIKNTFCPSILIEIGMITNPKDVEKLLETENIEGFSDAVCNAILEFRK